MKSIPRWLLLTASALLVLALGVLIAIRYRHDDRPTWSPLVTWDHAPLTVHISEDLDRDAVRECFGFWNRAGCTLLIEVAGEADVTVEPWEGLACGRPSSRLEPGMGGTWSCATGVRTFVDNVPEARAQMLVACHELGHALGLGHQALGIMAEEVGEVPMPFEPTPATRAALRGRYCR